MCVDWQEFNACAGELPDLKDHDAILISGSRYNVTDADKHPWMEPLFGLLRAAADKSCSVRMVGVCFGCQAIAHALGGSVRCADDDPSFKYGSVPLEFVGDAFDHDFLRRAAATSGFNINSPAPDARATVRVLKSHGQFVDGLPDGAKRLAHSAHTPNEMFCVSDRILAVQFHPEFHPKVMEERIAPTVANKQLLRPEQLEDARATFAHYGTADETFARGAVQAFLCP